jgi:hypothetical protein
MIRTRLITPHLFGCIMQSPWRFVDVCEEACLYENGCKWLGLACTNPDCPAVLLVHEGDLLDAIAAGGTA